MCTTFGSGLEPSLICLLFDSSLQAIFVDSDDIDMVRTDLDFWSSSVPSPPVQKKKARNEISTSLCRGKIMNSVHDAQTEN